ncbi:glycosyltransferase [Phocaeicola sp.]
MEIIDVSIVIVCMNNLENLYPCLDSIRKYTMVSYETLVVAYLFSKENLEKVRHDYPWITLIESNEIRGFSENNNLALRQAKGKYCFVVNDDTELRMSVIDVLVDTIEKLPARVAVISPVTTFPDGAIQVSGRPFKNWVRFILQMFHLWSENKGKTVNQKGIFKSYNIVGAAFLIKTDIFKKYDWFDEIYFFCPEDVALSTLLNKEGYDCFVNSDVKIVHKEGMSGKSLSYVQTATRPAACRGSILFYAENNVIRQMILSLVVFIVYCFRYIIHGLLGLLSHKPNVNSILAKGDLNCIKISFSNKTPKEIFIKYFIK